MYTVSVSHRLRQDDLTVRLARKIIGLHQPFPIAMPRTAAELDAVHLVGRPSIIPPCSVRDIGMMDRPADIELHMEQKIPLPISKLPSLYRFRTLVSAVLYVPNAASLAKPHAIKQLSAELIGYVVDVAVVSKIHLKKEQADNA